MTVPWETTTAESGRSATAISNRASAPAALSSPKTISSGRSNSARTPRSKSAGASQPTVRRAVSRKPSTTRTSSPSDGAISSAVSRAFGSGLETSTLGASAASSSVIGPHSRRPSSLSRHSSAGTDTSISGALCRTSSNAAGEIREAPRLQERGRLRPGWGSILEGRERSGGVECGDSPVELQLLPQIWKPSCVQSGLERAVLIQDRRCRLRPDPGRTGNPVRWVAAKGDEVRYLSGLDPVSLPHLRRPDASQLRDAAHRRDDHGLVARQLEQVSVRRDDDRGAAAPLLVPNGRGDEVVRLVPVGLRSREPERFDELRQQVELLQQRRLEDPSRLVLLERLVPVGRRGQRVPADEHRARLLHLPEPDEHVRESDNRVLVDRLRQRVVRAVRERIPVDDEQRLSRAFSRGHESPPSAGRWRPSTPCGCPCP